MPKPYHETAPGSGVDGSLANAEVPAGRAQIPENGVHGKMVLFESSACLRLSLVWLRQRTARLQIQDFGDIAVLLKM